MEIDTPDDGSRSSSVVDETKATALNSPSSAKCQSPTKTPDKNKKTPRRVSLITLSSPKNKKGLKENR